MTSIHEHIAKDVAARKGWGDRYTVRVGVAWYDFDAGKFRGYNTANNDNNGVDFNGSVAVVTRASMLAEFSTADKTFTVVRYALKDGAAAKYLYRPNVNTFPAGITTIVESTQTLELESKISLDAVGVMTDDSTEVSLFNALSDNGGWRNNAAQFVIEYIQVTPTP